ncbi:MAG: carboxypeptidase M32 [Spirochaetaceae bacterium]|jgi:carboxypeptidase Taq|nr:carboxypeptidase M32 [Spirochaetaceae bacterium]
MADKTKALAKLHSLDTERMHLERAAAVLRWDQETCLPAKGVEDRAEQLALIEGFAHEKLVNPETEGLLGELEDAGDLSAQEEDFLRVFRRDFRRAQRLSPEFVRECARAEGLSQAAWVEARKNSDFAVFAPHLEKMIALARKKSEYWGWAGTADSPYDGLLDIYEPGLGAADMAGVFYPLRERLSALLEKISAKAPALGAFLTGPQYDVQRQDAFCRELLGGLGFDFTRSRLDLSAHPFTTTLGFNDVRITTRYAAAEPLSGLFSVIHEGGHGFYELGIDPALRSSCLAEGTSMGIHESQSRLWENVIGRSRAFWEGWFPRFKEYFPQQLSGVGLDSFYRAMNRVSPSLIRVEADEVSYSLHIILRFELERRLFQGTLAVQDLPGAWNRAMEEYLGLRPACDAQGILQDVHWSMGAFGYFPSYALGNLYGLQFWEKLRECLPDTDAALGRRDYAAIHRWLGENIYRWGRRLEPSRLLLKITGKELSAEPFLRYIERKYTELYEL